MGTAMASSASSIYLYDQFPDLNFDKWEVKDYRRFEEEEVRPALEAAGWSVGEFWSSEKDSFGPLSRAVRCQRQGQAVTFWYG